MIKCSIEKQKQHSKEMGRKKKFPFKNEITYLPSAIHRLNVIVYLIFFSMALHGIFNHFECFVCSWIYFIYRFWKIYSVQILLEKRNLHVVAFHLFQIKVNEGYDLWRDSDEQLLFFFVSNAQAILSQNFIAPKWLHRFGILKSILLQMAAA